MDLILSRRNFRVDGIFGVLKDPKKNSIVAFTLEHSYLENGMSVSKIPLGEYTCRKGLHRLKDHRHFFETYEVLDVPGHSGILFHMGNVNQDSEGCILVGLNVLTSEKAPWSLEESLMGFHKFIDFQVGVLQFNLKVIDESL